SCRPVITPGLRVSSRSAARFSVGVMASDASRISKAPRASSTAKQTVVRTRTEHSWIAGLPAALQTTDFAWLFELRRLPSSASTKVISSHIRRRTSKGSLWFRGVGGLAFPPHLSHLSPAYFAPGGFALHSKPRVFELAQ